ncbi:hypothetical protein NPIL_485131 [Nephila pilipes]|uniref:Uncharacterized protein n=1 Tax=Nephila pilipes TaxID=299642 RepID=A0A8X6PI70_NEPPI|nr:hypothetical protein NPIL_485131 [Nephila pilipes]
MGYLSKLLLSEIKKYIIVISVEALSGAFINILPPNKVKLQAHLSSIRTLEQWMHSVVQGSSSLRRSFPSNLFKRCYLQQKKCLYLNISSDDKVNWQVHPSSKSVLKQ